MAVDELARPPRLPRDRAGGRSVLQVLSPAASGSLSDLPSVQSSPHGGSRQPSPARRGSSFDDSPGATLFPQLVPEPRESKAALRKAILRNAGSAEKAFEAMDVARCGRLDAAQFEAGLRRLGVLCGDGGPAADIGHTDATALFQELDRRSVGTISIRRLLRDPEADDQVVALPNPFRDTRTYFADYASRAALQRPSLSRVPRWNSAPTLQKVRGDNDLPDLSPEDEWSKQRRELRRRLRESDQSPARSKRTLVSGLVDAEKHDRIVKKERVEFIKKQRRIKGALDGCSDARHDLVALQQAMLLVTDRPAGQLPAKVAKKDRQRGPVLRPEVAEVLKRATRQWRDHSAPPMASPLAPPLAPPQPQSPLQRERRSLPGTVRFAL